jgi:glycosyltransferase involved in cell wall biosynthesis
VPGHFSEVSWDKRENGFLCIGRISREKRLEEIIDILSEVRTYFQDIHLHIIGNEVEYDKNYYQVVRMKVEQNSSWIYLEENLSHEELVNLVCQHRYGIHGMFYEHFGIAVAEMIRGGCIVFVHESGGQVEIIGNEKRLLYTTKEEAVEKIKRVLQKSAEQTKLRDYLYTRKKWFTPEKFMHKIQEIVRNFN